MQTSLIKQLINKRSWAIVGATEDTTKFGNKIYKDLKGAGYYGKKIYNHYIDS